MGNKNITGLTPVAKNKKQKRLKGRFTPSHLSWVLEPNRWLDEPPLEIWDHKIVPLLSLKELALARPVGTFFDAYWQEKFNNNVLPLRVPRDVATIDQAMRVIEILSSRREYTKASPLVVLLGKGDHEIPTSWTDPRNGSVLANTLGITRSNILFVGTGIDTTTIEGGFGIHEQENITFKNLTVTNTSQNGQGIELSNAKVELIDVAFRKCSHSGLNIPAFSVSSETIFAPLNPYCCCCWSMARSISLGAF